jgi:DNA invertase Pin-like site-specific DNA recombinase
MIPAAQYLRVSSAGQAQSLVQQATEIADFAQERGYSVEATYQDSGRSGLTLSGRPAFQKLLRDILSGENSYALVLVQDISRWGRFQDTDEAAHYEYICRAAGVDIIYCRDTVDCDVRSAALYKTVKRLMAADFSRDLSEKVRTRQFRLATQGYKMGGRAGFGLRRAVIEPSGHLRTLTPTERAPLGVRLVLVPGPEEEVATVQRIFRLYLEDNMELSTISNLLNAEGIRGEKGRLWNARIIAMLVRNPKYGGDYVYGRKARKLNGNRANRPENEWVKVHGVIEPLVSLDLVHAASARRQRQIALSSDDLWRLAQALLFREGEITLALIDADQDLPTRNTFYRHFGMWNRVAGRLNAPPPPHLSGPSIKNVRLTDYDAETFSLALANSRDAPRPCPNLPCSAFIDDTLLFRGEAADVAQLVVATAPNFARLVVIDDVSGKALPASTADEARTFLRTLKRAVGQAAASNEPAIDTQVRAYRILYTMGGHLTGYVAAIQALFFGDALAFERATEAWPRDVRHYAREVCGPEFDDG